MKGWRTRLSLLGGLLLLAAPILAHPAPAAAQSGPVTDPAAGTPASTEATPAASAPSDSPDVSDAGLDDRLKARAEALYIFLEGKRVNLYSLYQSERFRDFFTTERALQNYIAFLSTRLAKSRFRKFRIERTEVMGYRPGSNGEITIEVKLIGRHHQPFLFWDKTAVVANIWRNENGEWFVFPPPY